MSSKYILAQALATLAIAGSPQVGQLVPSQPRSPTSRKPTQEELQQSVDRQEAAENKRARKAEKRREILRKLEERQNA